MSVPLYGYKLGDFAAASARCRVTKAASRLIPSERSDVRGFESHSLRRMRYGFRVTPGAPTPGRPTSLQAEARDGVPSVGRELIVVRRGKFAVEQLHQTIIDFLERHSKLNADRMQLLDLLRPLLLRVNIFLGPSHRPFVLMTFRTAISFNLET
jgi:hypothetical protein